MHNKPAVILLSGGLDSATVLAMAKAQGFSLYALSLRYGQRHLAELDAAIKIAHTLGVVQHEIIDLDLARFGGSALTDKTIDVPTSAVLSTPSSAASIKQNDAGLASPTVSMRSATHDANNEKQGHRAAVHQPENIPLTYVPARNTIMLSIALGWMEVLGGSDLFLGLTPSIILVIQTVVLLMCVLSRLWLTWRQSGALTVNISRCMPLSLR